jgi:hypothetical protein
LLGTVFNFEHEDVGLHAGITQKMQRFIAYNLNDVYSIGCLYLWYLDCRISVALHSKMIVNREWVRSHFKASFRRSLGDTEEEHAKPFRRAGHSITIRTRHFPSIGVMFSSRHPARRRGMSRIDS